MHYLTISFSHKNSTIEIREKLSYPDNESKQECLKELNSSSAINESVLISTCNRIEVFCSCNDISAATEHIFNLLSSHSGISVEELEGRADVFDDSSAIHHIFSVVSSLDSLVVGETQIAGQIKDAFRFSCDNGFSDKKLSRALHHAFKCAAKVRNATDISSKPVSIASVAVSQLKSLFDTLEGKKVLVIGVGEMAEITAKHLSSSGASVYIMNRTRANAEKLASESGAKVVDYNKLAESINEFEILFSATASKEPIITDEIIKSVEFDRYWFDLALPRDINYHKGDRINLYQIDDLKTIVTENMGLREDSARKAHGIIGRSTVEFFEWLDKLNIEPMIKDIYEKAFEAAKVESDRVIEKGFIPKEYTKEVNKMAEQVLKRFLHDMTKKMRDVSRESKSDMGALQYLINDDKCNVEVNHKNMIKGQN